MDHDASPDLLQLIGQMYAKSHLSHCCRHDSGLWFVCLITCFLLAVMGWFHVNLPGPECRSCVALQALETVKDNEAAADMLLSHR